MEIKFSNTKSKITTIVDSITNAIIRKELNAGDNLLSINDASATYKVSRDTVFKAYNELKRRGVIGSTPMKRYYVKEEINRILLLLDNYSPFKKDLYQRFSDNLNESYKVDLIFHQYNENLFNSIVCESIGKYSMYVIMNFSNDRLSETLKEIPENKLLLLDFGDFEKSNYSYICQNFNDALYNSLLSGVAALRKYKKLIYIFPEDLRHPSSSKDYFKQFCLDHGFEYELAQRNKGRIRIEKSSAYLCIDTHDLVKVIKEADANKFEIGSDIGLIAYNDDAVLEVIKNGISAISVDFGLMGEIAAEFVKTKKPIQKTLPTQLIVRGSI